jgi:dolichol-phosphate mannosyltransferase
MPEKICVILPVYNEADNLKELYGRLINVFQKMNQDYELIFVNDGSTDDSEMLINQFAASNPSVKYIHFTRNFGHQQAIFAGLQYCTSPMIVTMDADLQDPPELIEDMYQKFIRGSKVIYARRKQRKGEHWFKKATAHFFYRLLQKLTSVKIPLDTGDFRMISKNVADELLLMPERNRFLRGQIAWLGYKCDYVDFDRDERRFGKTKFSLGRMIRFALDGITSFSNTPLQIASLMGFVFSIVAFVIILYALYSKFILGQAITGWTSIMISTMFIGGVQLLCIGIIGEYIGRIAQDVRKRPDFVIDRTNLKTGE